MLVLVCVLILVVLFLKIQACTDNISSQIIET